MPQALSVAMCTFNGAAFLDPQLDSIVGQTRPPDELVVCDDASTDATTEMLRRFATRAGFPVRIEVNPTTLGYARNFERAIGLCSGDVIVLSDQDDVWAPARLGRIEQAFDENPRAGAVFSDAEVVGPDSEPLGYTLWEVVGLDAAGQRRFRQGGGLDELLKRNVVTGATLALRARHRADALPIPPGWVHDAWIALVVAALSELVLIPTPLIQYRRHPGQQIGPGKRSLGRRYRESRERERQAHLDEAQRHAALVERLASIEDCPPAALDKLARKIAHCHARAALPQNRLLRLPAVLGQIFRRGYSRYSNGLYSAARDLLLP